MQVCAIGQVPRTHLAILVPDAQPFIVPQVQQGDDPAAALRVTLTPNWFDDNGGMLRFDFGGERSEQSAHERHALHVTLRPGSQ